MSIWETYSLWPTGDHATDTPAFNDACDAIFASPSKRGQLVIRDNGKTLALRQQGSENNYKRIDGSVFLRGESPYVTIDMQDGYQLSWGFFTRHANPTSGGSSPMGLGVAAAGQSRISSPNVALQTGDWVLISSDDVITGVVPHFPASGARNSPGELHRVVWVNGSDAYLNRPITDNMFVNPRIKLLRTTMRNNCGMADLQFVCTNATRTRNNVNAFFVSDQYNFRVENVNCLERGPGAIYVDSSAHTRISNFSGNNGMDQTGDYAVVVGTVYDFLFCDSFWQGSRHVFTTTGTGLNNFRWGTPIGCVVRNVCARIGGADIQNDLYNNRPMARAVFDTHAEGNGVLFDNCEARFAFQKTVVGGQTHGFVAFRSRSRGTTWRNCRAYGNIGTPVGDAVSNTIIPNLYEAFEMEANDCKVISCEAERFDNGVEIRNHGTNALITKSRFHNCGNSGILCTAPASNIEISYNAFTGITGNYASGSPHNPAAFINLLGSGNGHRIKFNELKKRSNTWAITTGGNLVGSFDVTGNDMTGYGAGNVGMAFGSSGEGSPYGGANTAFASRNYTSA